MAPIVHAAPTGASAADVNTHVHQDATSAIISLSWALLIIPCILLVAAFAWIIYNFSQPSEFPQTNGFGHANYNDQEEEEQEQEEHQEDEKVQLLNAFHESQSHPDPAHTPSVSFKSTSGSSWKIHSKFSTTSRGGSVYTSNSDPNSANTPLAKSATSSSPKAKRSALSVDGNSIRPVGSKAAKVFASNRDRLMQDLEKLDPIDREELQRSSSRTSDSRKSD